MTNLPNILTSIRILLVPILVVVLLTKFDGKEFVGLGLFLLAALTDFLDGYFARRWQLVTRFGQLLDPAADKILIAAAFVSLVELDPRVTPSWMVVAILARPTVTKGSRLHNITNCRSVIASNSARTSMRARCWPRQL